MFKYIQNLFNKLKPIEALNVGTDLGGKFKPTIVMLHGIGATYKTWDVLNAELDTSKYRIIAIDLLGCGLSPRPKGCQYCVDDHVKYLRKTIKKLKIRRPFKIVGHSMGSIIAARYCRLYPSRIKEVFLLSLPIYFKDNKNVNFSHKRTDFYLKAYEFISQKKDLTIKYSKHVRNILRIKDGINIDEDSWDGFSRSLRNTIIKQNTFDDISNLKLPVHIIFGALDEFLVQENVFKLDKFKNVDITKLSGINHTITPRFAKSVAEIINKSY